MLRIDEVNRVTDEISIFQESAKVPSRNEYDPALMKKRQEMDYKIYNHFYTKFDQLVKNFGEDKMAHELELLEKANAKMEVKCNIQRRNTNIGRNKKVHERIIFM